MNAGIVDIGKHVLAKCVYSQNDLEGACTFLHSTKCALCIWLARYNDDSLYTEKYQNIDAA